MSEIDVIIIIRRKNYYAGRLLKSRDQCPSSKVSYIDSFAPTDNYSFVGTQPKCKLQLYYFVRSSV